MPKTTLPGGETPGVRFDLTVLRQLYEPGDEALAYLPDQGRLGLLLRSPTGEPLPVPLGDHRDTRR